MNAKEVKESLERARYHLNGASENENTRDCIASLELCLDNMLTVLTKLVDSANPNRPTPSPYDLSKRPNRRQGSK